MLRQAVLCGFEFDNSADVMPVVFPALDLGMSVKIDLPRVSVKNVLRW
jgi:hypothetical protein